MIRFSYAFYATCWSISTVLSGSSSLVLGSAPFNPFRLSSSSSSISSSSIYDHSSIMKKVHSTNIHKPPISQFATASFYIRGGSDLSSSSADSDITPLNANETEIEANAEIDIEEIKTISPLKSPSESEESLAGSYKIVALLWISLSLDLLLNPTKRVKVFGTTPLYPRISHAFFQNNINAQLSFTLASGFFQAAGMALLCSLDSQYNTSNEKNTSSSPLIRSMSLWLGLFGICQLVAQAQNIPYLGMSAGVIQVHNILVAIKEWMGNAPTKNNETGMDKVSKDFKYWIGHIGYKLPLFGYGLSLPLVFQSTSNRAIQIASTGQIMLMMGSFWILQKSMPILNGYQKSKKDILKRKGIYQVLNGITSISTLMAAIGYLSSIVGGYGSKTSNVIQCGAYWAVSIFTGLQCVVPQLFHKDDIKI